ncbi:Pol polyprotein [Plakobranchus ocellatus]|uniref:Pol polyprotein n=1 Tax=Plakobranchus ocellatus TaxID=259542 RepID=A0AAV4C4S8_9GAST|nr:Pol polyprotein [Plakobranchus ocellatus]
MTMMGVERMTSTPYYPQSNGMVERLNGSLQMMLNKLVEEKPDDCQAVLFACREVPNTSTGYAPFKLIFGREVRGPIDVLARCISGAENRSENICPGVRTTTAARYQFCL